MHPKRDYDFLNVKMSVNSQNKKLIYIVDPLSVDQTFQTVPILFEEELKFYQVNWIKVDLQIVSEKKLFNGYIPKNAAEKIFVGLDFSSHLSSSQKNANMINDFIYGEIFKKKPLEVSLMHLGLSLFDYQAMLNSKNQFLESIIPYIKKILHPYFEKEFPSLAEVYQSRDWLSIFSDPFNNAKKMILDHDAIAILTEIQTRFEHIIRQDQLIAETSISKNEKENLLLEDIQKIFFPDSSIEALIFSQFAHTGLNKNPKNYLASLLGIHEQVENPVIFKSLKSKKQEIKDLLIHASQFSETSRINMIVQKAEKIFDLAIHSFIKFCQNPLSNEEIFSWHNLEINEQKQQIARVLNFENFLEIEKLFNRISENSITLSQTKQMVEKLIAQATGINVFTWNDLVVNSKVSHFFSFWQNSIDPIGFPEERRKAYRHAQKIVESFESILSLSDQTSFPSDYKPTIFDPTLP